MIEMLFKAILQVKDKRLKSSYFIFVFNEKEGAYQSSKISIIKRVCSMIIPTQKKVNVLVQLLKR